MIFQRSLVFIWILPVETVIDIQHIAHITITFSTVNMNYSWAGGHVNESHSRKLSQHSTSSIRLVFMYFFNIFGGHKSFLWGHSYSCFGLLVTSALGFSQGGSLAWFNASVILRFTSGVTLADCIEVSMAAKPFRSMYLQILCWQAMVGVRTHNHYATAQHCKPFGHSGSALLD